MRLRLFHFICALLGSGALVASEVPADALTKKIQVLCGYIKKYGEAIEAEKVLVILKKLPPDDQNDVLQYLYKFAPGAAESMFRALSPLTDGSATIIDTQDYLDQALSLPGGITIPGSLRQFADQAAEAKRFYCPYPRYPASDLESLLSKGFYPYIPRVKRAELFKQLYLKNNLKKVVPAKDRIIPPIIHQIWLGPKSFEKFERMRQTWLQHHPGWIYKLWIDEDVKKLKLVNQDLFDRSTNYGEKSDILRYELLYLFGGVYVDMDAESIRPLDILNHCYEFYCCMWDLEGNIINHAIAATQAHPILRETILSIPERVKKVGLGSAGATGSTCLTTATIKLLPQLQDKPIGVLLMAYLHGSMATDYSGALDPLPYTFIAHAEAYTWNPLENKAI